MKYAKLVNGAIRYVPKTVLWQGHIVNNPSPDKLLDIGYLPVTYTDMPTDAPEGQHYESAWEQTDTEIVQTWKLVEDPVYPEPVETAEERLDKVEKRADALETTTDDVILMMADLIGGNE